MPATEFIDIVGLNLPDHLIANEFLSLAREDLVGEEQLRRLALAEFHSQEAQFAAYGLLMSRYPHEVPGSFFAFVASELARARRRLVDDLAPALGLSRDVLRQTPRLEPVRHLTEYVSWVALHAGAAEAALAARTGFVLWCNTCAVLCDVLKETDHAPEAAVDYIRACRTIPPEVSDGALDVIDHGRTRDEPEEWITRSAVQVEPALRSWWKAVAQDGC
ncbi:hypothetical protein ACWEWL_32565 [Streptomyces rochei]